MVCSTNAVAVDKLFVFYILLGKEYEIVVSLRYSSITHEILAKSIYLLSVRGKTGASRNQLLEVEQGWQ